MPQKICQQRPNQGALPVTDDRNAKIAMYGHSAARTHGEEEFPIVCGDVGKSAPRCGRGGGRPMARLFEGSIDRSSDRWHCVRIEQLHFTAVELPVRRDIRAEYVGAECERFSNGEILPLFETRAEQE